MRPSEKAPTAAYAELEAVPDHMVGEVVDGELVASPRPTLLHAIAASSLGAELIGPFQRGRGGPGGWWIVDEPELHLGPDVLVPDLAGWRTTRMAVPSPQPFVTLAPDWVCEVLSPSTAAVDRVRKKRIYAREGVEYAWLLDPAARILEVYRLQHGQWVEVGAYTGDARVRAEPFGAVELELAALWPPSSGTEPPTQASE